MIVTDREGLAGFKPLSDTQLTTVLLVEADPLLTDSIIQTVKQAYGNIDVVTAQTEAQCLAHIKDSEFDCVLLDLDLVSTNGAELVALIRNIRPGIPLVAMTSEAALAVGAIESGATGVFLKRDGMGGLSLLPYSVRDAVELARLRECLKNYTAIEEQLVQAQKMASIGELTAGVVHDFNNMLATIILASQMINMEIPEGSLLKRQAQSIQSSAERGAELASRLLSLARAGRSESTSVEPNSVIEDIVSLLRPSIKDSVAVQLHLEPNTKYILADRDQLSLIILNLALHARDAMPDGGELSLSTENVSMTDRQRCQKLGIKTGDYVRISVSDTGGGIDKDSLGKVFEPSFTTEEATGGTSLRLLAVRRIVERHNGGIEVVSEPGKGTRFSVYIPSLPQSEQSESAETDLESLCGTERILVVDDKDGVRESVSQMLALWGYEVLNAEDGPSAIELYRQHKGNIDAVLMDLRMSGMDGIEAYERLKQIDDSVLVVLTSGYGNDKLVAKAAEQGVAGFIKKPYKMEQLLSLLRELLDRKGPGNRPGAELFVNQPVTSAP